MDSTVTVGPLLLTEREAAKRLAISTATLSRLRKNGEIGYVAAGKNGRNVRYCPDDLTAWIAAKRKESHG